MLICGMMHRQQNAHLHKLPTIKREQFDDTKEIQVETFDGVEEIQVEVAEGGAMVLSDAESNEAHEKEIASNVFLRDDIGDIGDSEGKEKAAK